MFKKSNIFCCLENVKPIYDYVDEYDYYTPIIKYEKEYNIKFNYTQDKNYIKNKTILPESKENDNVIQHYIKSSKDISTIIVYPSALKYPEKVNKLIEELKNNGNIYYIKNIPVSFIMMLNLIFQLYFSEKRMKNPKNIYYKCNRIGFNYDNKEKQNIMIIIYKHKNQKNPISGNSSEFKNYLRNFFLEEDLKITKYKEDDDSYPRLYDYLHVSNNDNESYDYAGIFFNKNSIHFLDKQYSWKINEWPNSIRKFNKIKEFLNNYTQKEIDSLIIISSGVLFSHGIREMNDVDGLMIKSTKSIIKPTDIENLNNKEIDISYPGIKKFNDKWEMVLNERAQEFGASNYIDLILNPKYHYYFMGIKFLRLKYEVITRLKRGRPAQITDLLVIRQMYNFNYKLTIPNTIVNFDVQLQKDIVKNVDENDFLQRIAYYLESRYKIYLDIKMIKEWILNLDLGLGSNNIDKMKGGNKLITNNQDISNDKYIYPTIEEIIQMGYLPKVIIYGDNYPFLYPSENFSIDQFLCKENLREINISDKLSVMSFNVHNFISRCNQGYAPLFTKGINPFDKPRDINKFIKLFKKYNTTIICLQEVVPVLEKSIQSNITDYNFIRNNFNFEYFNKLMENIGYKYRVIANTKKGARLRNDEPNYYFLANAIYSKIPIIDYEIVQYSFTDRNFINIAINYKNMKINIINLHFEYFNNISLRHPEIKDIVLEQFIVLGDYIKNIENNNIILCGDFNINLFNKITNNPRYKENYEKKVKIITELFTNTSKFSSITNFIQNSTTDYILINKKSKLSPKFSQIIKTNISDHYPVITYFNI